MGKKERRASTYEDCTIYCLESSDGEMQYIGATCNFKQRAAHHKYRCNNPISEFHNYNVYKTIRQNGGYSAFEYRILEELSCENRTELGVHEKRYIEMIRPSMNTLNCGTSKIQINREYIYRNNV